MIRPVVENSSSRSLSEAHRTVSVPDKKNRLRKYLAFAGPGFMVSVGYMDPGNWATDLEGGSRFGYRLLWVILASNLMAILLQCLCVRLGLVTGKDLAQACRDYYKRPVAIVLWLLCEIAIIACDIAEVIGSAIAIKLLSHGRIPIAWGVILTGLDVLLLLSLGKFGFRKVEAIVFTLVATVAGCFAIETFLAKPHWGQVLVGLTQPSIPNAQALTIAVGILGATVMPHNLYLHSAIVQTRANEETPSGIRRAIRYNTLDTILSLGAAFFVNAAILVLAGTVFHQAGSPITELEDAYGLLTPLLGAGASTAFAVALLASGQSSTITGTLAGQIIMEGFLQIKVKPWVRRIVTRSLAIIPAVFLVTASGDRSTTTLLVWSQVVLSLQLSFAIFPLLLFTSDRTKMGEFVNPRWLIVTGYLVCGVIAILNLRFLFATFPIWLLAALMAAGAMFALWVKFAVPKPGTKMV